VTPEVKFCGITRAEDAIAGAEAGARYLGLVFTRSPRQLSPEAAQALVRDAGEVGAAWVGVFRDADLTTVIELIRIVPLSIVQFHEPITPELAHIVTRQTGARVWSVGKVEGSRVESVSRDLVGTVDVVLFDASQGGHSGGLGVAFDWQGARTAIDSWRGRTRIGVAGGLSADNVGGAIRSLEPDVVDVSSGVERAPGIKDPQRMQAFMAAVRQGSA
jgi:phosphoribosylanthranilate isomerase